MSQCPINPQVTDYRISSLESAVGKIAEAVQEIAHNTTQIAQLEVRHAETRDGLERAFSEIRHLQDEDKKCDARLKAIEVKMPGIEETSSRVRAAAWGLVGFVMLALVGLVVVK